MLYTEIGDKRGKVGKRNKEKKNKKKIRKSTVIYIDKKIKMYYCTN